MTVKNVDRKVVRTVEIVPLVINTAFLFGLDSGQSGESRAFQSQRKKKRAMSKQSEKEDTTLFQFPFACTPSSSAVYSHYQHSPFTMSQPAFMQSGSPPYYGHPIPPHLHTHGQQR